MTKQLQAVLLELQKKYGKNTIDFAKNIDLTVHHLPTGIPSLDFALLGGIPRGRTIHCYGPKLSGKTWLALRVAAQAQKFFPKKKILWNDLEDVFSSTRPAQVGIDMERVVLCRPITAEDAFDTIIACAATGEFSMIVVDSVAAVAAKAEQEAEMVDQQMGVGPRVINKFFRKYLAEVRPMAMEPPVLWMNNQLRETMVMYGKKTKAPGGRGLPHYASVELELGRGDRVKLSEKTVDGDPIIIGSDVNFRIEKSNISSDGEKGKFLLCTRPYNLDGYSVSANDVDWPQDLLKHAVYYGVVEKSGSWFNYGDIRLGQGKVHAQATIFNNGEIAAELACKVMEVVRRKHGVIEEPQTVEEAGKGAGGRRRRKN